MNKLLNNLIEIDEIAGAFYGLAIASDNCDHELSELFTSLYESRAGNRDKLLVSVKDLSLRAPANFNAASISQLKKECSEVFVKATALIQGGKGEAKELLEFAISIELMRSGKLYSEAIDALRKSSRSFISIAAATQLRRRLLETYISNNYEYSSYLSTFEKLPRVWIENLLIADDSMATATLLADTLSGEGSVSTAGNGVSALEKLDEKYFAAIISDVSMPLMGGVDFYRLAEKKYPGIGRRFIFFTDTASMHDIDFFKVNKINYLPKPSPIKNIRRAVLKVMSQNK